MTAPHSAATALQTEPSPIPNRVSPTDLTYVWDAHSTFANTPSNAIRKFNPTVPYVNHPYLCASLIQAEPNLPSEVMHRGALALLYHDVPEDTKAPLPPHLQAEVVELVKHMTFFGGSAEEMGAIWTKPAEVQLLKLYDKVSNLMDGSWMSPAKRELAALYVELLANNVERHYPGLNITTIAKALTEKILPVETEPRTLVRLSVGNLVPIVRVGEESHYFGFLNRKAFDKGERLFGALGGAASFTPEGLIAFSQTFGTTNHEGNDLRCVFPERYLPVAFATIRARNSSMYEVDPKRELVEELTKEELKGMTPVFGATELDATTYSHVATYEQPASKAPEGEIQTRRLFNLFEITMPPQMFERFRDHPAVKMLTLSEISSTKGGASKGKATDGSTIANNLFIVPGATATDPALSISEQVKRFAGMVLEVHSDGMPTHRAEIVGARYIAQPPVEGELRPAGYSIEFSLGRTKRASNGEWIETPAEESRASLEIPSWAGFSVREYEGRFRISSPITPEESFFVVPSGTAQ